MTPEERAEVAKPYAVFLRAEEADADALATDSARRLGIPPRVVRGRIRTLRNDLYDLADSSNDGMDVPERAKAKEKILTSFAEKLEDLSNPVKLSQRGRTLRDLVLAEEPAARARVREQQDKKSWPALRIETLVHYEIVEALKDRDPGLKVSARSVRLILSEG